jgi:hypothetical protein
VSEVFWRERNDSFFNQIVGLPFIISTVVAGFSFAAYTIRETSIKKWEKIQEEKHLLLSQDFTRNEIFLSQTMTSLLNITYGSNKMILSGHQSLWNIMLKIKHAFPPFISLAYSIYTKDEFNNLLKKDNPQYRDKSSIDTYLKSLGTLSNEAEELRLTVNINSWNIYWTYQFFFGRIAALYSIGIEKGTLIHFIDEKATRNALEKMIEAETLEKLSTPRIFCFQNIVNFLEIKFIEQFSSALSGFSVTKEAIDKALEINRLVNDTSKVRIKGE